MRLFGFCLGLVWAIQCFGAAPVKSVKIRGYVTEVSSQREFEIDDYRIMRDESMKLEFEKDEDYDDVDPDLPKEIRIGTEIEIKGDYNSDTHELKAKSVKIFPADTRRLKRTALLEQLPQLTRKASYWEGILRADGQTLIVDERTKVVIAPNQSQKKSLKEAVKAEKKAAKAQMEKAKTEKNLGEAEDEAPTSTALIKLDEVHTNMFVAYEGRRLDDGRVWASKIEFKDNELTSSESRLWKSLTPKVKGIRDTRPGELQVGKVGKFKTTPNEEVQRYVRTLGESLIPTCQRSLSPADPTKVPFQFHVVEAKVPNAFATANGVIVVHAPMLQAVENEAQLAFILSHEIAHATQEHTLRQMDFHKKKRFVLALAAAAAAGYGAHNVADLLQLTQAAIASGYSRYLENQADRVGMEYMIAAGYDPREAPRAWKAMSLKYGDAPANFFWSSHDNNTARRSYLMAELRNNYPGFDFSKTVKDRDQFRAISGLLQPSETKGKKVKVKK